MIYFPHCPMVLAIYFGWRCLEVNYLNLHVHSVNKVYAVMKSWRDISFYGLHIMLSLCYNDYIQLENPAWFHIDSQKDKWPSIKALQKPVCASKKNHYISWLVDESCIELLPGPKYCIHGDVFIAAQFQRMRGKLSTNWATSNFLCQA